MTCRNSFGTPCGSNYGCPDEFGCPPGVCPDFIIRRHDTKPAFKVSVEDCDGPLDLTGLVLEVNMWAKGKLKKTLAPDDTYFALADNIGFNQIMVGDILVMDRIRRPEQMLVVGFDELHNYVLVERGFNNTEPGYYKKGCGLRIMRTMNAPAQTEMVLQDIQQIDGTTEENVRTDSFLVYEWASRDTCLPGCYWLEFKLLKLVDTSNVTVISNVIGPPPEDESNDNDDNLSTVGDGGDFPADGNPVSVFGDDDDANPPLDVIDVITTDNAISAISNALVSVIPFQEVSVTLPSVPSFSDISVTSYGCDPVPGVEWVRRFPVAGEGFLVKVIDSPTAEI